MTVDAMLRDGGFGTNMDTECLWPSRPAMAHLMSFTKSISGYAEGHFLHYTKSASFMFIVSICFVLANNIGMRERHNVLPFLVLANGMNSMNLE